ncbi:aminoglycoside phosphotransferase family protein [Streptacidiphilus pinicola]|uniref:aminoglycoside phosphotransferase family protein n=1 Tax=Streptacidiphilus pinicola TaxID=2219663 RepID=UPI001402E34B|nr:aminoglycoside phosphotransferase family protein [Streptacidiphilus pinicola]
MRLRTPTFRGFHNVTYLTTADSGEQASILRERRPAPVLVPRIWPDEAEVLRSLEGAGMELAPRVLWASADGTLLCLTFLQGESPAPEAHVRAKIGDCFKSIVAVPRERMPELPLDWPEDGDTGGFLQWLAMFAEDTVDRGTRKELGTLLEELGIPDGVMTGYRERLPRLRPRPFALLHADLHRNNLVLGLDGELRIIDWEHAMIGDPVHELAVHLRRSAYSKVHWQGVVETWRAAVSAVDARFAMGVDRDLGHYLDFERAQSVFPDVLRAAKSLGAEVEAPALRRAVQRIGLALAAAAEPLDLRQLPDAARIEKVLRDWHHVTRAAARTGS